MENTVRETVERLFNISSTPENIINYSADQVINILRTDGELYLTDESPVDIIIKYVPDNSVDTGYLYTLAEDLEDEGYEVMCMVQDYIKRIRPTNYTGDIRLDLGTIVNEFKIFAAIKDIPVISASQLNRDATKHIDEGRKTNKADLLRLLGRSNIGESMLMLENIDCGFMLAPEFDQTGAKYMGIQRIKMRYRATNRESIYQPFAPGNAIKLVEDFASTTPVFKDSMRPDVNENTLFNGVKTVTRTNVIRDLDTDMMIREDDKQHNFFNSANLVNINSVKETTAPASALIKPIIFENIAV
jgi:replicative DNA helicase